MSTDTPSRTRSVAIAAAAVAVAAVVAALLLLPGDDATSGTAATEQRYARNVILLVGDGMGAAHRELGRLTSVGPAGELAMNKLEVAGLVHTGSTETVTDSAAAATAMATGVKTDNEAIGVDPEGNEVESVLDRAREVNRSTGLVTTSEITDATPAAFGASVPDRDDQVEIARQLLLESKVDVLLGGGEDYWFPEGQAGAFPDAPPEDPAEGSRSSAGDLVAVAQAHGYSYVASAEELSGLASGKVLGLFANQELYQAAAEGQGDVYAPPVSLADMTRKALELLSRDESGFFLVVEEEAIDEFAHANNAPRTAQAVAALDDAVAVAVDFAAEHPDTLVVVAADHATGGLAIEEVEDGGEDAVLTAAGADDRPFSVGWTTTAHTGDDVPVTAQGPGADNFDGVIDNTGIHAGLLAAMGFDG